MQEPLSSQGNSSLKSGRARSLSHGRMPCFPSHVHRQKGTRNYLFAVERGFALAQAPPCHSVRHSLREPARIRCALYQSSRKELVDTHAEIPELRTSGRAAVGKQVTGSPTAPIGRKVRREGGRMGSRHPWTPQLQ